MDLRFAVLRHIKALNGKDTNDASDWLSDKLSFHTEIRALSKTEMLDIYDSIFHAFPDWEIIYDDLVLDGRYVHVNLQMQGTHTNTLSLNIPGSKPLPATGKQVWLPKQKFTYKVEDNQITEIVSHANTEAGLFGIMKQIGAKVPPVWWLKLMWKPKSKKKKEVLVT